MEKIFLLLIILLLPNFIFGQKENNNWNLSDSIGFNFETQNFFPTKTSGGGGGNSISNSTGNLLFYTGYKSSIGKSRIYNALNELIENGDSLRYSFAGGQIIFKRPTNDKKYYLFYIDQIQTGFNLYHIIYKCLVDMAANEGKGKVIYKDSVLYYEQSIFDTQLSACKHSDGKSWWLLAYERSQARFIRFLIKNDTIIGPDFQSFPNMTPFNFRRGGEMLFSPSGTKMVFCSREPPGYTCFEDSISLEVYGFDRCTGLLDNRRVVFKRLTCDENVSINSYANSHSAEFSPDEQFLYFNTLDSLYQLDLTKVNPYLTRKSLDNFTIWQDGDLHTSPRGIELGPDGKIYISYYSDFDSTTYYLGTISEPNKLYPACNYTRKGLYLNGRKTYGFLPNMPNYNLQGLPHSVCGPARFIACSDSAQIGAPRQSCQFYSWAPAAGLSDSTAANPKAAPQFTTTYTLTTYIDGSDQTDTDTVTVHVTPFPNGYVTAAPQEFSAPPFTVHFKAAGADTSGLSFHWDFGDQITGQNAITSHEYPAIDGYLVKLFIQDSSGTCKDTIAYFLKLSLITGINETLDCETAPAFKVYPNPARASINLEALLPEGTNAKLSVFNPTGQLIETHDVNNGLQTVLTDKWAQGIYLFQIKTDDGKVFSHKIVILN